MDTLGIFVKHPIPGRVKTRLAADIGNERAAELYAAFVADVVTRFRTSADRRTLCYTPDDSAAREYFRSLADSDYSFWPQPDLSLGERMESFFIESFSTAATRTVIIGSDSPTLSYEFVERAFDLLDNHDCVLGPATDGGYYLIGQRAGSWPIFSDIDWGSSKVFDQTVASISACGANLALLPPWYDVDTLGDLDLLRGDLAKLRLEGKSINLDNTERLLGTRPTDDESVVRRKES